MASQNYFESRLSARRYAAARPDVHRTALSLFADFSQVGPPFGEALDVACGTGQSTLALVELARHVVGIDSSDAMLRECELHPRVDFIRSEAESIPANDESFDLIVVAQAFHWFEPDAFLAEAQRVLTGAGWLLIYNAWFTGEMKENRAFAAWFREGYLSRYPTPPRNRMTITDAVSEENGFVLCGSQEFSVEVSMTPSRFTDYQLSTTNVIAAVGERLDLFDDAEAWITNELAGFFGGAKDRTFPFSGRSWYLQKRSE